MVFVFDEQEFHDYFIIAYCEFMLLKFLELDNYTKTSMNAGRRIRTGYRPYIWLLNYLHVVQLEVLNIDLQ